MQRITLHVPELLNDGEAVPDALHSAYEAEMLEIASLACNAAGEGEPGLTILRNVTGVWRCPAGVIYREPMRLYWLDVADPGQLRWLVDALVARIKHDLNQQVVYATRHELSEWGAGRKLDASSTSDPSPVFPHGQVVAS